MGLSPMTWRLTLECALTSGCLSKVIGDERIAEMVRSGRFFLEIRMEVASLRLRFRSSRSALVSHPRHSERPRANLLVSR